MLVPVRDLLRLTVRSNGADRKISPHITRAIFCYRYFVSRSSPLSPVIDNKIHLLTRKAQTMVIRVIPIGPCMAWRAPAMAEPLRLATSLSSEVRWFAPSKSTRVSDTETGFFQENYSLFIRTFG